MNPMKTENDIKLILTNKGLSEIEYINFINNSLYFVKTKESAFTYDVDTDNLEESFNLQSDNEEDDEIFKFTEEEKNKVAEENLALVHYVLKGFSNTGIDYDELEGAGNLGFAKALNSFNKNKGIRFATYAINCITNEILFFLRKEKKHIINTVSMQKELNFDNKGNPLTIEDTLEDEEFSRKGIEYNLFQEENKKMILRVIQKLNDEEQYIILHRYGINGTKEKTQKQLADELNMSQANISKLQRICIKKLKFLIQKEMSQQGGL